MRYKVGVSVVGGVVAGRESDASDGVCVSPTS